MCNGSMEINKAYCMDNLELMEQMEDESVDLIYCDILYGTGRNFGDYRDLKPIRSEIEAHYLPRLKEMYRVLKDTGSIYLQMDTRINHWIRCIMDDVFGYDNFRNGIIWDSLPLNFAGFKTLKKTFIYSAHYILFYSKTKDFTFNKEYFKYKEKDYPLTDVWKNILSFNYIKTGNEEGVGYPTQKPKALLERIIKASSNENDIVADFYMGSGTSIVVAKELNRQFIGCDISQKAVDITNQRLLEVIERNKLF